MNLIDRLFSGIKLISVWLLQVFICLHDLTGKTIPVQVSHIDYVGQGNDRVGSVIHFGGKYIGVKETIEEVWNKIRNAEDDSGEENGHCDL